MKTQIAYFCPKCQNIDVEVRKPAIIDPTKPSGGKSFFCPLCKTEGDVGELIGALNPENKEFWTGERIGHVMTLGAAKVAAGPMLQLLELIGLVPDPHEGEADARQSALKVREAVVRDVISAFVEASFLAAAEHAIPHFEKFGTGHEAVEVLREGTKPAEGSLG
jgi:hypothetical protein